MKKCTKCLKNKQLSEYPRSKQFKSGIHSQCKACRRAYLNAWQNESRRKKALAKPAKKRGLTAMEYKKLRPDIFAAAQADRRAAKKQATPAWLTFEQRQEIKEFYKIAKELQWLSNEELQVDHIVPLQGKNVCGLHVPWNLQILPKTANVRKGNKLCA